MGAPRDDARCRRALHIVTELCQKKSLPSLDLDTCREFLLLPSDQSLIISEPELSVSLLAVIVIVCGLALVAAFLFLFWKLCWVPWRNKALSSHLAVLQSEAGMADKLKDSGAISFLEAAVKISHTSPDIPAEVQMSMKDHIMRRTRIQRQTTEPASSTSCGSGSHLPVWVTILPLRKEVSVPHTQHCEESVDLGEIMFSLCYLPTAGRLTLTVIKCRNLKAMDITGYSDPYVKVSLLCDGRRLKKKKTTIKKNTLNPTYNEAIIFDIPPENMDQVSLLISVMDYDRVGHNEIIGVCRVGGSAEGLGRDHWNEMLAYPRKPIAHWHPLVEVKKSFKEMKTDNSAESQVMPMMKDNHLSLKKLSQTFGPA
ncbi:hypothetical protein WISP_101838 [Willisornis vidua]|uniref:C2 domain-containing protein n=1 Tax=Willisornis vidua TaxID=1566151 RepID=A0ABQ9D472_9PASS|nr:hypothetical protein WISP_101838 [Willisornis vidua]